MPNEPMERIDIEVKADVQSAIHELQSLNRALSNFKKIADTITSVPGIKEIASLSSSVGDLVKNAGGEGFSKALSNLRKLSKLDFSNLAGVKDAAEGVKSIANTMNGINIPKIGKKSVSEGLTVSPVDSSSTVLPSDVKERIADATTEAKELKNTLSETIPNPELEESLKRAKSALSGLKTVTFSAEKGLLRVFGKLTIAPIKSFTSSISTATRKLRDFLSSIKRVAFYRAIRAVIAGITKGIKEGIGNLYQWSKIVDGDFAASMNKLATSSLYLKNSLGAAFSPIINAAAPLIDAFVDKIVDLINEINRLFALLSGASSWTKAIKQQTEYAEAAGDTAKAANELKKSLMGFDELNVLSDPNSGLSTSKSTPDYAGMFEEVQFDGTSFAEKIKNALPDFSDVFGVFKKAWENEGTATIRAALDALRKVRELVQAIGKSFREVFTNGTGQETLELILKLCQDIFNVVGNFAGAFQRAWENNENGTRILQAWWNILNDILNFYHEIAAATAEWLETLDLSPLLEGFAELSESYERFVEIVTNALSRIYKEVVLPVLSWVLEELVPAVEGALSSIIDAINAFVEPVVNGLLDMWHNIEPIVTWVEELIVKIINGVKKFFDDMKQVFDEKSQKIREIFSGIGEIIAIVWDKIKPLVDLATEQIGDFLDWLGRSFNTSIGALIDVLHGAVEFIAGVLTGDWTRAWEGLKEIFQGCYDAIVKIAVDTWETLKKGWNDTKEWLSGVWNKIKELASSVWDSIKTFFIEIGKKIKETILKAWEAVKTGTTEKFNDIKSKITGVWTEIKTSVVEKITSLKNSIHEKFENIKSTVKDAVEKLKSFFKFDWELPKIKLPHFIIEGEFSLNPPSIPHIAVDWYANGGFPETGQLFAAREAGPELVGEIGRRTTVANNEQIIDGISSGVKEANEDIVNALYAVAQQIIMTVREKDTSAYIDGRKITREVTNEQNRANRMYGRTLQNV